MAPFGRLQPSAGGRWRSAGTNSPQGLFVSGLTPLQSKGGAASGRAKPVPPRLLGEFESNFGRSENAVEEIDGNA